MSARLDEGVGLEVDRCRCLVHEHERRALEQYTREADQLHLRERAARASPRHLGAISTASRHLPRGEVGALLGAISTASRHLPRGEVGALLSDTRVEATSEL